MPEQCRAFTTTAQRYGAREIQSDVRGKATRRVDMHHDHELVVGIHAGDFVGAVYIEPYPELAAALGNAAVFLRWLIVDDAWRGRDHRGERAADVLLVHTLDVVRQRDSVIAAGLVHAEHTASRAMLNRTGFVDISDLVQRPYDGLLLMAARVARLGIPAAPPA